MSGGLPADSVTRQLRPTKQHADVHIDNNNNATSIANVQVCYYNCIKLGIAALAS